MTDILQSNSNAVELVRRLWTFFGFQLICRLPQIDKNEPSYWHIEIEQFLESHKTSDLAPTVVVRDSARREEALVHELLHLELIRLRYPRFRVWANDDQQWKLAGGIFNYADHLIMLPMFISLGYGRDKFLGRSATPTALENRVHSELDKMEKDLRTSKGYAMAVSKCLESHSIRHEVVWIAEIAEVDSPRKACRELDSFITGESVSAKPTAV
jgi:hypothetical protein